MSEKIVISASNYVLPLLNEYVILFDSTLGMMSRVANSTTLVATAGAYRGMYAGCRVDGIYGSVTENVTLVRQIWDRASASAAWQTVDGGSDVLTAGTVYPVGWVPEASDFRIYMLAGATAPSAIIADITILIGDRSGGT